MTEQHARPRPIDDLLAIMARLRDPDGGCPWDLEQTFATIVPYTIEEAYEVADAIERDDMHELQDELGDLLLQVVFHSRMAEEEGHFAFNDVVGSICHKMIRRHPNVFADAVTEDAEAQRVAWEEQKAQERAAKAARRADAGEGAGAAADARHSVLDGLPVALPALTRALKIQNRVGRVGFDWPAAVQVIDKIEEELEEVREELDAPVRDQDRVAEEIGDLLFAVANLARKADVDPESALRHANAKFEKRFRAVEDHLEKRGRSPETSDLEEMEALWGQVKRDARP
ncbi:Nucleoside triphosphate pyrophosphohydrolase MazG [Caenispirillum salinarum AK4]|uniref:Nucleoside triphosphate pyrophosphohydrolase n=1 Tax=Caenispirillum salinarum AK4 TaxID=1238182 RepID=K9H371_9PROT|nr:nucleoside triphosphate pyrophosphohydrolase [Caenispirillum salinarum]EKV31504.1 Nucleoside triphosphate pyrophosphohydrolase MazG [Caenispirillum salinarum AK4]